MKFFFKLLSSISFFLLVFALHDLQAQVSCGNEGVHEREMNANPEYRARFLKFMEDIRINKDNPAYKPNSRTTYVIPVVVHLVYAGDNDPIKFLPSSKIQVAIDELNESYSGSGIQFCLAKRDDLGKVTDGINRINGRSVDPSYNGLVYSNEEKGDCSGTNDKLLKEKTKWPENEYLNIWAVSRICINQEEEDDTSTRGYAWFPWSGLDYGSGLIHGVIVDVDYSFTIPNDDKSIFVLSHEVGHFFGLFHTFAGPYNSFYFDCPKNNSCEEQGDRICDTPPHKKEDCNITLCTIGNWDNSKFNYMNYCKDVKRNDRLFTYDQNGRMLYWASAQESIRKTLLDSKGCIPPPAPDLTISNASVSPTSVDPGVDVTLSFRINNIGNKIAPVNYTSFHLSVDDVLTPGQNGDQYLNEYYQGQTIVPNSSTGILNKTVKIPANTSPGNYYIFFSADGAQTVSESDETNNWIRVAINVKGTSTNCTPSVPSGLSQTSGQSSATFRWSAVSGVQKYDVRYRGSGSWINFTTTNTVLEVPSLSCNTSYEWQVRSVCANGTASAYSSSKTFSTSSCGSSSQNDNCQNGTTIVSNSSCITGSVKNATNSYGANLCLGCVCTSPDNRDVYFKFVAQATSHTVTLSDYASNFDAVIEIRNLCQSGLSNTRGCYDPSGTPSTTSYTWSGLTIGDTYYIRVFEYNYSGTPPSRDDFKICVTHSSEDEDCDVFNMFPDVYYSNSNGGDNSDESLVVHTSRAECYYRVTKGSGCSFVSIDNPTGYTDQVGAPPYFGQVEVFYTLDENDSYAQRTCTLNVDGRSHVIIQNGCDPYFSIDAKSVNNAGETYTLEVDAQSNCSWNLTQSNCSWVTFSRTSGSGDRSFTVQVSPNTSTSPRTCQVTLNNGETHTINQQGYVCNTPNVVYIQSSNGDSVICSGSNMTLSVQTDCNDCSYSWSNGGNSKTITVSNAGKYSVIVSNLCGSKTAEVNIKSITIPPQPGSINGPNSLCIGESLPYSIESVNAATYYTWSYSTQGFISGYGNNINLTPEVSGILSVTANNTCGNSSVRSKNIIVNSIPEKPIISRTGDLLSSNYNTGNQWFFNGVSIPGAVNMTLSISLNGIYNVEHTDANGCKNISDDIEIFSVSATEMDMINGYFQIYPNPNNGTFNILADVKSNEKAYLNLIATNGQFVYSEVLFPLNNEIQKEISIKDLAAGLYIVQLIFNNDIYYLKMVVDK